MTLDLLKALVGRFSKAAFEQYLVEWYKHGPATLPFWDYIDATMQVEPKFAPLPDFGDGHYYQRITEPNGSQTITAYYIQYMPLGLLKDLSRGEQQGQTYTFDKMAITLERIKPKCKMCRSDPHGFLCC